MLREAHDAGVDDALRRFGLTKTAGPIPKPTFGKQLLQGLIGQPKQILSEGMGTFRPGGALHWKNVFWPDMKGAPIQGALGRMFGTILPAYGVYKTIKGDFGDPNEGRLSNVLGALGGAVGGAYGYTGLGALGGSMLARGGEAIGRGLGRALGSHPTPPPAEYEPAYPSYAAPMQGGYY